MDNNQLPRELLSDIVVKVHQEYYRGERQVRAMFFRFKLIIDQRSKNQNVRSGEVWVLRPIKIIDCIVFCLAIRRVTSQESPFILATGRYTQVCSFFGSRTIAGTIRNIRDNEEEVEIEFVNGLNPSSIKVSKNNVCCGYTQEGNFKISGWHKNGCEKEKWIDIVLS